MQRAVVDVFATFIDMQVVCRDMQVVSTDAEIAFAREKCATFRFRRFSHAVRSRESSGNRVCRGFPAIDGSRVYRDFGGSHDVCTVYPNVLEHLVAQVTMDPARRRTQSIENFDRFFRKFLLSMILRSLNLRGAS